MNLRIPACFLFALLLGCGIKSAPVSRDTLVAKRIVDLEAIPRDERLILTWSVPKENTDKSPLKDLEEFRILRSEGILAADGCRGCGEKTRVVHELKVNPGEDSRGKRVSLSFQDHEPRKVYVYEVVSVNRKGYPSPPSNPVTVYWDYTPSAPGRVKAERGDKKVDLFWEEVLGASGYNVYRRKEEEAYPPSPLNRRPLTETMYTDLQVENDKRYVYSIRAVKQVVKTEVEGRGTLGIPVTPMDLIPPGPPAGLVAVSLPKGVELNWRKNPEPDLLGYFVYRRNRGEETFKRLHENPVTRETFLDKEVEREKEYDYAVTAVDQSMRKNESPFSEEISVTYSY